MLSYQVSLMPFTTFGVNAVTQIFYQASDVQDMIDFLKSNQEPYVVLGGGSNILFVREKVSCVVQMCNKEIRIIQEDENTLWIEVGAGVVWDDLVLHTVQHGWYGLENLSAIPGHVGASPVQNIGAYGVEAASCIHSIQFIDRETLQVLEIGKLECEFSYRDSIFKNRLKDKTIITKVVFELHKTGELNLSYGMVKEEFTKLKDNHEAGKTDLMLLREAVIRIRESKLPDPKVLGNVGSYFKNPIISQKQAGAIQKLFPQAPVFSGTTDELKKISAAWLIEQVGMKGYRMARVGVHNKQALVLVNHGGATAGEILALENLIILNVESKFGVHLSAEVNKY